MGFPLTGYPKIRAGGNAARRFGFCWIEDATGNANHQLPVPSVFLVGTNGKITFAHINPDYTTRLAPDVLLAAARAALPAA